MAKKDKVSETPATAFLRTHGVVFSEHPYDYLEHGGAQHSAQVLGLDPFSVVKTLIMQDQDAKPLVVLMHGNCKVSTKNLVLALLTQHGCEVVHRGLRGLEHLVFLPEPRRRAVKKVAGRRG